MKFSQMIFPVMIFMSFLLFGRWTGKQIERSVQASDLENAEKERLAVITKFDLSGFSENSYAPALPSSRLAYSPEQESNAVQQKNLLIIGVDDLTKPRPELVGLWLVLYITNMPQVTLMPVYPAVAGENGGMLFAADEQLAASFKLASDGSPHPDFLKMLSERELWWSNYAVLDTESIAALLAFSRGSEQRGIAEVAYKASEEAGMTLPDPQQSPEGSLLAQTETIQRLCHTGNLDLSTKQISGLVEDLTGHLNTDISPEVVLRDLESMLVFGGGFICEFPSLTLLPEAN